MAIETGSNPFTHNEQEALQLERILFFSDAVFAIAITLLVIEIKVPEMDLHTHSTRFNSVDQLQQQWPTEFRKLFPKLIGFVFSFLVIGQYWLNHHRNFGLIRRFNRGLLWRNLLLLMSIAFIPFSSGFYFEYPYWSVASSWYTANIALTGLIQWWLWRYASGKDVLLDASIKPHVVAKISLGHLAVPIAFSLAFLGSLFGNPYLLAFTWIIIPLMMWLARRRYEHHVVNAPPIVQP